MNRFVRFFDRVRLTRRESMALLAVFSLYLVGLTWRHAQQTTVAFDAAFYDGIDSVSGPLALDLATWRPSVLPDTVPRPRKDSAKTAGAGSGTGDGAGSESVRLQTGRMNINAATVRQLTLLPGIGPTLARRIVEFRRTKGKFQSPRDLLGVRGIGPKTLAKFEGMIVAD
jgi:competence protein ComEA